MKITILDKNPDEEDEIIVKCSNLDENIVRLLNAMKTEKGKMIFYREEKIYPLEEKDILYFESVENRVFAYTNDGVFESKDKLYMLEESLSKTDFMRANKSTIINLNRVESLSPAFGSRFEAVLENGCKIIISRMYVAELKKMLGLE